jgi:Na+/proline symporter
LKAVDVFIPVVGAIALSSFWKRRRKETVGLLLGDAMIVGCAVLSPSPLSLYVAVQIAGNGLVVASSFSLALFLLKDSGNRRRE